MSNKFRGFRRLAAPIMLTALAVPLAGGCSAEDLDPSNCAAGVTVKVEALTASANALVEVAGKMKVSVGAACATLARANGDTVEDITTDSSDDDLQAVCAKAEAALTAQLSAAGSISLTIEGGKCEVAASAQLDCEANCSVDGSCSPGSVEARCEPGELSVSCEGECAAGASCEGSATVAANCEGSCSATCEGTIEGGCEGACEGTIVGGCEGSCQGTLTGGCEGTCEGTCSDTDGEGKCIGTCEGTCTKPAAEATCSGKCTKIAASATCSGKCKAAASATCSGTCTGSCTLAADAKVKCGADVKCKGECKGTATAPKCEANLTPPDCDLDADCSAGCEGQASLKAECTPPTVKFNFTGDVDADFLVAIEASLPAFLNVMAQGELAVKAAADVVKATANVAGELVGAGGCAIKFGADFTARVSATAKASASVNVSVNASASASGKASSGG